MRQLRPDRTLGLQHAEFWAWCDKGELRFQRCTACTKARWPVSSRCDSCGTEAFEWQQSNGRATVVSWVSFYKDYYEGLLPVPHDTILVELAEGVLFMANPLGFSEADYEWKMPVELSFIDCTDIAGPFRLPVFRKVSTGNAS